MKKTHNYFAIVFLFLALHAVGQTKNNKWTFGMDVAWVRYSEADKIAVGGKFINQTPRFSLAKYMFKNVVFVGSVSTAIGDNQTYTTFDGAARYDFGTSQNKVVPYALIGGSFINARVLTPTLNFGAGSTLWFSPKYGLNVQLLYKFSEERFSSQRSHIMPSIGLVYSFGARDMNPRIWSSMR